MLRVCKPVSHRLIASPNSVDITPVNPSKNDAANKQGNDKEDTGDRYPPDIAAAENLECGIFNNLRHRVRENLGQAGNDKSHSQRGDEGVHLQSRDHRTVDQPNYRAQENGHDYSRVDPQA